MIQRVQSVYLFIAALAGILLFYFPINSYEFGGEKFLMQISAQQKMVEDKIIVAQHFIIPSFLLGFTTALAVFTIFKYNNRAQQIKLCFLNLVLTALFIGFTVYNVFTVIPEGVESVLGIGAFLPTVMLISIILARRAIQRDEELIKSADRIR